MALIDKINASLLKLGVNLQVIEMAKAPVSGATSGETSGSTSGVTSGATTNLPSAVVDEIIPQTIKISYSAVGAPVIATDADGKEENVMDGEYILVSGQVLVIADGKLVDLKPAEMVEVEETSGDTKMRIEAELAMANLEKQRIDGIIDLTKNGTYTLNIDVNDGVITYGTLYTNTYQNLLLEKEAEIEAKVTELTEAFESKISGMESVIEALKTGETKIVNNAAGASDVKLSKSDYIKLDIQQKINNNKI